MYVFESPLMLYTLILVNHESCSLLVAPVSDISIPCKMIQKDNIACWTLNREVDFKRIPFILPYSKFYSSINKFSTHSPEHGGVFNFGFSDDGYVYFIAD